MIDDTLRDWIDQHAEELDRGTCHEGIVPRLAQAGVFEVGVPEALGGRGETTSAAIEQIASLAEHSLTVAFVAWGQRAFIEYLLHSGNEGLRTRLLAPLLRGELAGATGLSNAMKFLSGLEELSIEAHDEGPQVRLEGRLPWVTNLRTRGFVVACAVDHAREGASIYAVPGDTTGLARSADLDLMGLRGSDTAALRFSGLVLGRDWQLHDDAPRFLRGVRPAFLGLQCGLAIGLSRSALRDTRAALGPTRSGLVDTLQRLERELTSTTRELMAGVTSDAFLRRPESLFRVRIRLNELALAAVQCELESRGGKAYVLGACGGFGRRWREAAFLPIVTPSSVQLRAELDRAERQRATA